MTKDGKTALLETYWKLLRDHFLWHVDAERIAQEHGISVRTVRSVIRQAWQLHISAETVTDFMSRM